MTAEVKHNLRMIFIIVLLAVVIIVGGVVSWLKYKPVPPLEISLLPAPDFAGNIYIGGAVANPGYYPFTNEDSITALFQAAGGITVAANVSVINLNVTDATEGEETQKIDINRAEVWLLEALPGIGKTLAQRIVDYRQENGPFRSVSEITRVEGIGDDTYEQIKHLITVAD